MASAEAYILFYKKDPPPELEQARLKVRHGLKQQSGESEGSVLTSYISRVWLAKFFTVSDPGPVENSSVICRHGSVLPCRAASLESLVTALPSQDCQQLQSTAAVRPSPTSRSAPGARRRRGSKPVPTRRRLRGLGREQPQGAHRGGSVGQTLEGEVRTTLACVPHRAGHWAQAGLDHHILPSHRVEGEHQQ